MIAKWVRTDSNNLLDRRLGYSVRRYYVDRFFTEQIQRLTPRGRVLDLGGHKRRKRGMFDIERYALDVTYANLAIEKGADVIADASCVPLRSSTFDAVICGELVEHVIDPQVVLSEAFRLIKDKGILILTVPFLHPIHADPSDYGRYTDQYWESVLSRVGFSEIVVERQGMFYSVLLGFAKQYLNHLQVPRPFGRIVRWLFSSILIAPLRRIVFYAERQKRVKSDPFLGSYTTGYGIVAQKLVDGRDLGSTRSGGGISVSGPVLDRI